LRAYTVLARLSASYSVPLGRFPRVTHPSATPYCYGVRLACVRPAASVRSEPGSNSQIERFDSGFGLEVIQGIICVTGTFTLDDRTPHSRSHTQSDHHGDGLKRRLARVCLSSEHARRHALNPPGLRRLRFPSFLSLVKEQQCDQKTPRPPAPLKHLRVATETRSGHLT
jgi:hypothetical protein